MKSQLKHSYVMNKNLLLLKDLVELLKTKFTSIWLQSQKKKYVFIDKLDD